MINEPKSVEVRIPSIAELLAGIPRKDQTPSVRSAILAAYQAEVTSMLHLALDTALVRPRVEMELWRTIEGQRASRFAVRDMANSEDHGASEDGEPEPVYCGTILVRGRQVSRTLK